MVELMADGKRGGAREGAGRPKSFTRKFLLRLTEEQWERLEAYASQWTVETAGGIDRPMSKAEALRELIDQHTPPV